MRSEQERKGRDEKMTTIEYMMGMSRDRTRAVYYMRGYVMTEEGVTELYAELPASRHNEAVYKRLREKILEQAVKQGVDVDSLVFYYDRRTRR